MNSFIKFFLDIKNYFWVKWSNFRFRHLERFNKETSEEDIVKNVDDIVKLTNRVLGNFKYKNDDITQLFDAIVPPPQTYQEYLNGLFEDDCDGFHSLVYHCLQMSNIKCYLLITTSKPASHCTLVFKLNDLWYVVDYNNIFGSCNTLKDTLKEFNTYFESTYTKNKKVVYNALVDYNYSKGKFRLLNYNKVLKEN